MPYDASDVLDDNLLYQGTQEFNGVDAYNSPSLLPESICARLVNRLVTDNKRIKVRPGFGALSGAVIGGYSTRIQGLAWHSLTSSTSRLLAVCNTNLHAWDGSSWSAAVAGWTATNATRAVQFAQLNKKQYLVDATQAIYEFDGTTFAALTGPGDPPAGASILCAHAERLFASGWDGTGVPDRNTIRASDVRAAGTGRWRSPEFEFQVGPDSDPVTCLVSMLRNWLVVGKSGSLYMVECPPSATSAADWQKHELTRELGIVGPRAAVQVGGDCWFWSQDGIRSISASVGTEGAWTILAPLTQPMQLYVDRVNQSALATICAWRYRELVLFSVPLDAATTPSHTLVFNTRLGQWMGVWQDVAPLCWATTRFDSTAQRLVMGDSTARVNQWKDLDDQDSAATYTDNAAEIAASMRLKTWNFGEKESLKDGDFYVLWFDRSTELNCTVTVTYDDEDQRTDRIVADEAQNELPVELPFDLASEKTRRAVRHLDSLGDFREMYLTIDTTAGNNVLVAATGAAFLESVRD